VSPCAFPAHRPRLSAVRILKRSAAPINWMTQPQAKSPGCPSTYRGILGQQGYFQKFAGAGLVARQTLPRQKSSTGHTTARILQGCSDDLCSRQTPSQRFARIPRFHKSRRRRTHPGPLKYPLDQGIFEGDRIFDMPEATQAANLVSAFSDGELGFSSSPRRERLSNSSRRCEAFASSSFNLSNCRRRDP
jgi:hypothetical protein